MRRKLRRPIPKLCQKTRIEECFDWLKPSGLMREVRHPEVHKVDRISTFTCEAYNLTRMQNLVRTIPAPQVEAEVGLTHHRVKSWFHKNSGRRTVRHHQ
jgi:hypothetical protein